MKIEQYHRTCWHSGIQAEMICMLLLTTTIIFGGFTLLYYQMTQSDMNEDISNLADFFSNQLSTSLTIPLWHYENEASIGVLDATMNEKQVYAIFVKDKKGEVIFGRVRNDRWESVSVKQTSLCSDCVIRQKTILKDKVVLGAVEVFLTIKFMRQKLYDAITNMLITLILLNILLFLMLFFSIKKIIISPIGTITIYLSRLSVGDIPTPIVRYYRGEFNEIKNSLNMLIDATHQATLAAEDIANGNLTVEVKERSENDRMMQALNQMIQRLNDIMKETKGMIQAVENGRLDIRGNANVFNGGWQELVSGVNELISGLSSAVSEKTALGKEMELAKKIQTCLLPEKPEIQGYEIAASCQPSAEVGGDYYDVISVAGYDWIVIGDVSGHGVSAGLVMMMVQTAIYTVLLENPVVSPSALLVAINKTIYNNIAKMHESKHMTIIVLAVEKEGLFAFSGLHENILIWRSHTGKVDSIETDGMWIGIDSDISNMLVTQSLKLETGDCMVLYTDGITESRGKDRKMFGEERLISIIESVGEKSAHQLHADILNSLKSYEKCDDMTLFVMKRI